ncbi:MAG TPA: hypothetical protein VKB76_08415, partial [Ktedonobacterales bacterium]|nr:hypothetical protein [Ktedonobacterales bacterium]
RNLWDYLRQIRRTNGTTVLLTTHYLEEAETADDVCILNHGKVVAHGSPAQLKAQLTEAYLRIDAVDRLALRGELQQLRIPFADETPIRIPLDGSRSIQQIIGAITTPLALVETHAPTLEDAYLEIVRDTNHA